MCMCVWRGGGVRVLTISTLITGFQLINNQYWKTR